MSYAGIRRVVVPGQPHHLTQRGNNRMQIFCDESDYIKCLELILSASVRYGCIIHAYVLMGNHFHLIATPIKSDSLSRMMQSIASRYARYFNNRYHRTGTLWEGRFRSSLIESGRYFYTCCRYVELNPVRALLVDHPSEYRWSSFHSNATGAVDSLVTPHFLYDALGPDEQTRRTAYFGLFAGHLDADECRIIRKVTRQRRILGSNEFQDAVASQLQRPVKPAAHGGDRRSRRITEPVDDVEHRAFAEPRQTANPSPGSPPVIESQQLIRQPTDPLRAIPRRNGRRPSVRKRS